ncbi:hypothetical protein D3C86_1039710 [compost metagenome]
MRRLKPNSHIVQSFLSGLHLRNHARQSRQIGYSSRAHGSDRILGDVSVIACCGRCLVQCRLLRLSPLRRLIALLCSGQAVELLDRLVNRQVLIDQRLRAGIGGIAEIDVGGGSGGQAQCHQAKRPANGRHGSAANCCAPRFGGIERVLCGSLCTQDCRAFGPGGIERNGLLADDCPGGKLCLSSSSQACLSGRELCGNCRFSSTDLGEPGVRSR